TCPLPDFRDNVIGRHEFTCPGAHRSFGQGNEFEVDDLRGLLPQQSEGALELGTDQLVVCSEDIDHPVEVGRLPCMECEIPGRVDGGPVTATDHVLVLEAKAREIKCEGFVVNSLRKFTDTGDDPLGVPVPDEIALPDEPVVRHVEVLHSDLEPVKAPRDFPTEFFDRWRIPVLYQLHQGVHLLGDPGVFPDLPVRRYVDTGDVGILLLARLLRAVEVIEPPDHDCNLAAHVVHIILHFERIACFPECPGESVADDRVSYMSHVQRTVRVGARMLKYDPGRFSWERPVTGFHRGLQGFRDEFFAEDEVQVRTFRFNSYSGKLRIFCQLGSELLCNFHRRLFLLFCQGECNGGCHVGMLPAIDELCLRKTGLFLKCVPDCFVCLVQHQSPVL